MKKIIAAGGLVFNGYNELLFIYRRGKWDLPKGKLDAGETIEECAVREVEEETGVSKIELGNLIQKTYHEYFDKWVNARVTKETWWYLMKVNGRPDCTPQAEEEIEKIIWANEMETNECLKNSFPTIVELVNTYLANRRQLS